MLKKYGKKEKTVFEEHFAKGLAYTIGVAVAGFFNSTDKNTTNQVQQSTIQNSGPKSSSVKPGGFKNK